MNGTTLWTMWRGLVLACALTFTRPGAKRFVQWVTGIVINAEEHTITQSLFALHQTDDWAALESFAEYGAWDLPRLQSDLARLAYRQRFSLWFGYHVSAV